MSELIEALRSHAIAAGNWREQTIAPQTALFEQGDDCDTAFILLSGLVRLGYHSIEGDDWIKSFICDEGLFGAEPTTGASGPIAYSARCIETSRIVRLPRAWIAALLTTDAKLLRDLAAFTAWVLRRKQAREEMLLCLTPEERYRRLLAEEPKLAMRLMQSDIARYIGVTPIAFSRIKRRVASSAAQRSLP